MVEKSAKVHYCGRFMDRPANKCLPYSGGRIGSDLPNHGEVYTEADTDEYDPRVLGRVPNGHQYGYCWRCKQPLRWDVARQQWMEVTLEEIAEDVVRALDLERRKALELREELR